jgi:DNA-binding Lrp family transcriptional regulator
MVRAFVMVKAASGAAAALKETILEMPGVEEAHVVAGAYDLVVEVTGGEVYDVVGSVATDLRALDDVADTRTYICLE